jgi:iron(III) transport system permease protein
LDRTVLLWLSIGAAGYCLLPWYTLEDGFWGFEWLFDGYPFDTDYAPGMFLLIQGEKPWLWPLAVLLLVPLATWGRVKSDPAYGRFLLLAGGAGFFWLLAQGFAIGIRGWQFENLQLVFGAFGDRQFGMGYGAILVALSFLFAFTQGLAARGAVNGDVFVISSIGFVVALVGIFIMYPIAQVLVSAVQDDAGDYAFRLFTEKMSDRKIWGLGCLTGQINCGVAWNSLFLAILVGALTTLLGSSLRLS